MPPELTLKDYFAGQALAGLLAGDYVEGKNRHDISSIVYSMADAMIAERKNK